MNDVKQQTLSFNSINYWKYVEYMLNIWLEFMSWMFYDIFIIALRSKFKRQNKYRLRIEWSAASHKNRPFRDELSSQHNRHRLHITPELPSKYIKPVSNFTTSSRTKCFLLNLLHKYHKTFEAGFRCSFKSYKKALWMQFSKKNINIFITPKMF